MHALSKPTLLGMTSILTWFGFQVTQTIFGATPALGTSAADHKHLQHKQGLQLELYLLGLGPDYRKQRPAPQRSFPPLSVFGSSIYFDRCQDLKAVSEQMEKGNAHALTLAWQQHQPMVQFPCTGVDTFN